MRGAGWPASSPAAAGILLPAAHLLSSSACLTAVCGLGKDRAPVPCSPSRRAGAPGSGVMRCLRLARRCLAWLGKWHGGGGRLQGGPRGWGSRGHGRRKVLTLLSGEAARHPEPKPLPAPRAPRPRQVSDQRAGRGEGQSGTGRDAAAWWRPGLPRPPFKVGQGLGARPPASARRGGLVAQPPLIRRVPPAGPGVDAAGPLSVEGP